MMGVGAVEWALILPIVGAMFLAVIGAVFLIAVASLRHARQQQAMPGSAPCPQCKSFVPTEKRSCPACGARLA